MAKQPSDFLKDKVEECWRVDLTCIQDQDDESGKPPNCDNEFVISMCKSPGGGWYFRIKGEIALEFDEIEGLKHQLDKIAETLNWK